MGEGIHTIRKTDRSYQRDTEKGLNRQEAYTVNKVESQIRNRKTEKGYVIGDDGKIIGESVSSSSNKTRFRIADLKKDSIVTHNHPTEGKHSGLYGTMAGRIGVPFSMQDVKIAVQHNLKEIRAVTPTYTWSLRRPKGGWGNYKDIERALSVQHIRNSLNSHDYDIKQRGFRTPVQRQKEVVDRANVVVQYQGMKALAKQFGWEFTRRKVK